MGKELNGTKKSSKPNINFKKTKNMIKYYLKETGKELHFGDEIILDFTEDEGGKTTFHHLDCKFVPGLVPYMLEAGIITKEGSNDDGPSSFEDIVEELINTVTELEKKVKCQTEEIAKLRKQLKK